MKNSQKGFVRALLIIIALLFIGGIIIYFNQDKILSSKSTQYIGNKLGVCIIEENRGDPVSPISAQAVSLAQVNRNNPPFKWVSVGYYPIYGSSGVVNYYAFVFRKSEFTKFTTLSSLELNASLHSDTTSDESDKKYQFNDIASVLTGSAEGDALIIRHYRGIPEIVGRNIELNKYVESKYTDRTIGNIIMDSPMGKSYYEIVDKSSNRSTGEIIGLDYAITTMNELAVYQTEVKNRKDRQYVSFDQKECNLYKQALIEREVDLRNQWSKYAQ